MRYIAIKAAIIIIYIRLWLFWCILSLMICKSGVVKKTEWVMQPSGVLRRYNTLGRLGTLIPIVPYSCIWRCHANSFFHHCSLPQDFSSPVEIGLRAIHLIDGCLLLLGCGILFSVFQSNYGIFTENVILLCHMKMFFSVLHTRNSWSCRREYHEFCGSVTGKVRAEN